MAGGAWLAKLTALAATIAWGFANSLVATVSLTLGPCREQRSDGIALLSSPVSFGAMTGVPGAARLGRRPLRRAFVQPGLVTGGAT